MTDETNPQPTVNQPKIKSLEAVNAILAELQQQRDQALARCANMAGDLAEARTLLQSFSAKVKELQEAQAELQKRLDEALRPPPDVRAGVTEAEVVSEPTKH